MKLIDGDKLVHTDNSDDVIEHFGIKGMKWRKNRLKPGDGVGMDNAEAYADYFQKEENKEQANLAKAKAEQANWEKNKKDLYNKYAKELKNKGQNVPSYKDFVRMARGGHNYVQGEYLKRIKEAQRKKSLFTSRA